MESFFLKKRPPWGIFRPFFRSHGYVPWANFPLQALSAGGIFQKCLLPRTGFSRRNAFNSPHARPCPIGPGGRSDVSRDPSTVLAAPFSPSCSPLPYRERGSLQRWVASVARLVSFQGLFSPAPCRNRRGGRQNLARSEKYRYNILE